MINNKKDKNIIDKNIHKYLIENIKYKIKNIIDKNIIKLIVIMIVLTKK